MQISDLLNQYTSNSASNEKMTGTKGLQKMVSTLRELSSGSIFEGTVNSVRNGKVVLGLPNGQTVTARMEGKISLNVGQSMFFQVKSNNGTQLLIKPFTVAGNAMNLTLMQALQAANLPADGRHLAMVNTMMTEQMPIDAASLNQMERIASGHPDINIQTLVQMQKLDIPITAEFASQFENYLDDKQAIGKAMEGFMNQLPEVLSDENLSLDNLKQMNSKILQIMTEGLEITANPGSQAGSVAAAAESSVTEGSLLSDKAPSEEGNPAPLQQALVQGGGTAETEGTAWTYERTLSGNDHSLQGLLTEQQLSDFSELLKALPKAEENPAIFTGGILNEEVKSAEVLKLVQQILDSNMGMDKQTVIRLFASEGMNALIKDALEQQWLIRPEELAKGNKINQLYEKLENQISRMENVVKAAGQENTNLAQAAAEVRNNVDFMNQMNQAYTYVQIPLKMNGQNASGELYVYTNKKNLAQNGEKDLSAFLHLDLDHLGSTDVSIKLKGKKVDTNFYLEDDTSYDLIRRNLPVLQARLEKKGYDCKLTVINEGKHVNFVEDFLKKDQPSAGQLHRYSFDMRA